LKTTFLEFEQSISELEAKIEELRFVQDDSAVDISEEIARLQKKSNALTKDLYAKLTPWQMAQVARHPQRPFTLDYIGALFTDFEELHGDRAYADDLSIVGGLARFNGQSVMVIGQQKGRDTKEKILRNFGMPRPEGYRKAMRLMRLAEKFAIPVLTFVDTPGAYPGIGAEERGQSEAIGRSLYVMAELRVPVICTIIGEGGSGGALALAVGDTVMMLQYAIYSVISPDGHYGCPSENPGPDRQDYQRTSGRRPPRSRGHGAESEKSAPGCLALAGEQGRGRIDRGALGPPDGLWQVQGSRNRIIWTASKPRFARRCSPCCFPGPGWRWVYPAA